MARGTDAARESVVIRFGFGQTLDDARAILSDGRELTILDSPAYYGQLAGSVVYIERGGETIVIQAIWGFEGEESVTRVSQIGEAALARW